MLNLGNLMVSSLDYILIVDKDYRIIYNTRYDARFNENSPEYPSADILNKNYFDVYPALDRAESSVARCIETGEIIVYKRQEYSDYLGRRYVTNNVTFPLMRHGELIAVVELAMDADPDGEEPVFGVRDRRFDAFIGQLEREAHLITFDRILTQNTEMLENIEKAKLLAQMPTPILIYGETGTGKELFAQSIIHYSQVPEEKVVIQNCAAVPESLMEAMLFGTVRGAYTGAENMKGLFAQADGGILFLDELDSIPYHIQSKLLRVLQDGTFRPLGGNRDVRVRVKVIAAMNVDPMEAIKQKQLRNDLFYRLSGGLIRLLPLRERPEDVGLFLDYYMDYFGQMYHKEVTGMSKTLRRRLMEYTWDGNVRELRNVIESMVVALRNGTELSECHVPPYFEAAMEREAAKEQEAKKAAHEYLPEIEGTERIPYNELMETLERNMISHALRMSNGNRSRASEILGIPRQTLKYRIEKLHIEE